MFITNLVYLINYLIIYKKGMLYKDEWHELEVTYKYKTYFNLELKKKIILSIWFIDIRNNCFYNLIWVLKVRTWLFRIDFI